MNLLRADRWRRHYRAALLGLVASLVACSGADEDGERKPSSNVVVPPPYPITPPEAKTLPQVLPDAYATPRAIAELPERFRGRYAMVATDCAASGQRLTVDGGSVAVGRKRGVVGDAHALSPTKVRLALRLGGHGDEHWSMTLLHDGRTLLVERSGPNPTSRYQRCPAP